MYYVPAGMIAKLNPLYVKDAMEQYGYTAQQLSTLNIPILYLIILFLLQ